VTQNTSISKLTGCAASPMRTTLPLDQLRRGWRARSGQIRMSEAELGVISAMGVVLGNEVKDELTGALLRCQGGNGQILVAHR